MRAPSKLESRLQAEVLREIGAEPDLYIAKNSSGQARYVTDEGTEFFVPYGWASPGGPDLVGVLRGPSGLGVMVCWEVKAEAGRLRPEQETVHRVLRSFGAIVYVVRSATEARATLEMARGTLNQALGRTC
jgi:hypothetical protein